MTMNLMPMTPLHSLTTCQIVMPDEKQILSSNENAVFLLQIPIYAIDLYVYTTKVSFSIDHVIDVDDCAGYCAADNMSVIIGVFDNKCSTLVHEIAHATFAVMNIVGQRIVFKNSEIYAQLFEYLFLNLKHLVTE